MHELSPSPDLKPHDLLEVDDPARTVEYTVHDRSWVPAPEEPKRRPSRSDPALAGKRSASIHTAPTVDLDTGAEVDADEQPTLDLLAK